MPFKTMVAVIQHASDAQRVLDFAIPLAERFESHLIGVHAETLPMPYTMAGGFPDAEFMQVASEANKDESKKLEALFRARADAAQLSSEWVAVESFAGDNALGALAQARSADVVVAAQRDPQKDGGTQDLDGLLFDAGRPVLLAPHAGPAQSTFSRVLVAWNGSREASRATFDALPFLLEAEATEIFVVDPAEGDSAPGSVIAAALNRHGVQVTVATEQSGDLSIDTVIQNRVVATGADLLVLGAYSHSWLRELLFGGVTRSVIEHSPVATLVSR